jgi:hypothetical protein
MGVVCSHPSGSWGRPMAKYTYHKSGTANCPTASPQVENRRRSHAPAGSREERVAREPRNAQGPSGLGGWLVLPPIGLFLTPILTVLTLRRYVFPTLEAANWSRFSQPESTFYVKIPFRWTWAKGGSLSIDVWGVYFTFETLVTVALVAVPVFLLILFFQKKRAFSSFIIWCTLALPLVRLVDMVAMASFGADAFRRGGFPQTADWLLITSIAAFVASVIAAAVWIPYFLRSRRVKNTFLREWSSQRGGFWA